jgi:capsular polysaccharide biosynthesis protein
LVTKVKDELSLTHRTARGEPVGYPAFDLEDQWTISERSVYQIPDGRVFGRLGAVVRGDTFLFDLSPFFSAKVPYEHPIYWRLRLPRVFSFDGTLAILSTRGADNYYHFLLDVIPRLALIHEVVPHAAIDGYFVEAGRAFQRELLAAFGVRPTDILSPEAMPHVQATKLVVSDLPGGPRMDARWAADFLRNTLLPGTPRGERGRVYVSRGTRSRTRCVVNEQAVLEVLQPLGFRSVRLEEMSVIEQANLFRSAEAVVAPHGAGLANVAFCSPGTKVVELFSPGWLNTAFWKLSAQLDRIDYWYVIGVGSAPTNFEQRHVSEDMTVDLGRLRSVISQAGLD